MGLGEKYGGRLWNVDQITSFRRCLTDCDLDDMGTVGGWFTWSDSNTKERLDRGVCNPAWLSAFTHSRVVVLPPSCSDHVPLLLEVRKERPECDQERRLTDLKRAGALIRLFPALWKKPGHHLNLEVRWCNCAGKYEFLGERCSLGTVLGQKEGVGGGAARIACFTSETLYC